MEKILINAIYSPRFTVMPLTNARLAVHARLEAITAIAYVIVPQIHAPAVRAGVRVTFARSHD